MSMSLQEFCDARPGASRDPLRFSPFWRGGREVACNGHAMVVLERDDEQPDSSAPVAGSERVADELAEEVPACDSEVVVTTVEHLRDWMGFDKRAAECSVCNGVEEVCPRCDGDGGWCCGECEQDVDCHDCNGWGVKRCGACRGEAARVEPKRYAHVLGTCFDRGLVAQTASMLPDGPARLWLSNSIESALVIATERGRALVMWSRCFDDSHETYYPSAEVRREA